MINFETSCVLVYSYFMHVCSIFKTITPRCSGRPDALLHKGRVQLCIRSSTVPRGNSLTILQTGMKYLFNYPNHLMIYLAAFLEWSCCRRCGFDAKYNFFLLNLPNFCLKMFCSFKLRKRVPTVYVSDHKQQSY